MTAEGELRTTLLKLGGSLITDKRRPDRVRPEVLRRLAAEISTALAPSAAARPALILGHGSGSFGHATAARHRIHEGLGERGPSGEPPPGRLPGVARTQERAAALHRLVLDALSAEGLSPFSIAPSSAVVAASGRPLRFSAEPVALALRAGLLPVVYGDVVMDRIQGCAICSTESVFSSLVEAFETMAEGHDSPTGDSIRIGIGHALWAGATAGVLDAAGRTIEQITPTTAEDARGAARGAAGTDVTGGMLHRLEAALDLARRGISSLVFDGTVPGAVEAALRGKPVQGTRILPEGELRTIF